MIDYRLHVRGAAVTGQGGMMIRRYVKDVQDTVATFAEADVHLRLQRSLQNPHGHLQSQIGIRYRRGNPVVTDGGVIYGPWIEGVGSRNYPTTRFKGYATFRRSAQLVEQRAPLIADRIWQRYVGRF